MAPVISRAHVIKAGILACVLLILLNIYNYRYGTVRNQVASQMATLHHSSEPWKHGIDINGTDNRINDQIELNLNDSIKHSNQTIPNLNIKTNVTHKTIESLPMDPKSTTKSLNIFQAIMTTLGLNQCPPIPPNLHGPIDINITYEPLELIEQKFAGELLPGGWYRPRECNARDRVAIIIPYRDRAMHLPIFLRNIHPFLMRQQIEYGIFLIEQTNDSMFNRATLLNIGFVESQKLSEWDCFIFHDIDLLPMDDRNLYTCPDQPRHMSVAVDKMGFKLPYGTLFGGVSAMTAKQFLRVNGFSNRFWGWGGEDDDMSNRMKHVGYHIARYPAKIARYTMLTHRKEKANPKRYEMLTKGARTYTTEGLNSLRYEVQYLEKKALYTWCLVKINDKER